ncbi:MAG: YqaJ viral recombinase family protein [Pseudomonadota bacterium]|nr:YqaJ viral recombinase family protein [Pseudomonadota bacterium]
MKMNIHTLKQGTPGWLKLRLSHFTASEASAMMGVSKYMTREELLYLKKTGVTQEITQHKQAIFDKGHTAEELARDSYAQNNALEELFPVVATREVEGLPLLASFDGLTMFEDAAWEHKLYNESLAEQIRSGNLEPHYYWQLEQQCLVADLSEIHFQCSDGNDQSEQMIYKVHPQRRSALLDGWEQFAADLESFDVEDYETRQERTDDAWKEASAAFKAAKEQKAIYAEKEKEAKQRLIELANGKRTKGCDVNVYPMVRNNVDSKKIIADFNVNPDEYTTQSITWAVR